MCYLPFSSIFVDTDESIRTCCIMDTKLDTLSEIDSFENFLTTNPNIIRQQEAFNRGEFPLPECGLCKWNVDHKLQPYRDRAHNRLRTVSEKDLLARNDILFLDLTFGRLCNQSCATCGSLKSSKWVSLDKEIQSTDLEFRKNDYFYDPSDRIKNQISDEDLNKFIKMIPKLRHLSILGGEPLINPQCLKFLEKLIETNQNIETSITTNLAMKSQRALEIVSKIPKLSLDVSIDGPPDLYHWIRGLKIDQTLENIQWLKDQNPNYQLRVVFTLSAYNILRLSESIKYISSLEPYRIQIIPVIGPPFCAPHLVKSDLIAEEYESYRKLKSELEGKIRISGDSFIDQPIPGTDSVMLVQSKKWIEFMNKKRNLNLYEIVPTLEAALS